MRATSPQRRTFIGREGELTAVGDLLGALAAGEGRVLFVAGEPGIGKTALIAEVLERGRERGFQVLSGRAAEFERDLPFGVLADALEHRGNCLGERLRLLDDEDLAVLAGAFPALGSIKAPHEAAAQPDQRHRLLRALRLLLELISDERPLVLALDDLHWADAASIDLVCHLLHRGMRGPTLLVLASRPAQSEFRLMTVLEEAERHGVSRRIELAPLSVAEAEALLGEGIEPALHDWLYRESGGNPFYLEQLAGATRRGAALGDWDEDATHSGAPAAVSVAIRDELEALSAPARTLLRGAAAVGEPFEPDLAADAAGMEEGEALKAIDELLDGDLIRSAGAPRRFRFRHPIVRRAVYEAAGAGWNLTAHGRAAAALEARGAPAGIRAYHVERSAGVGDAEAVALLTQAGEESAPHAPASAARWFDAALHLLPDRGDKLELRLGLLGQRAAALGLAGRVEESRDALHEFLRLSPQRPDPLRLQAAVLAAILDELLGNQHSARRLLANELALLPDQRAAEAAELKRELAFTCFLDADWAATGDWARQSLAAECNGMVRVGALSAAALADYGLRDIAGAKRSVQAAAELFDRLTDEEVAAHHPGIAMWLAWAEVCIERLDDAIRHLERCIAISRASGQRHLTVGMLAVQGQALALKGQTSELVEVADGAIEAAILTASDLFFSWALTTRCAAHIQTGELHAAVQFGERAVSAWSATSSPLSGIARLQLAHALLEIGEPERGREELVDNYGQPDLPPFPLYEALCYELLARAELMLGKPERADEFAACAERAAQALGLRVPLAQARRARAMVVLERGEPRAAAEHALASAGAAEQAGAQVEAARSRTLAGRALAAAGDRDPAIAELEQAHELLSRCGAWRYRDEAAHELRKLGRAVSRIGGARSDDASIEGLTTRELEVVELVAAGMTNRKIASELFLSVRTVDRHVSRIFEKLGVNSRAAAASLFERARSGGPLSPPTPAEPGDRGPEPGPK